MHIFALHIFLSPLLYFFLLHSGPKVQQLFMVTSTTQSDINQVAESY